MNTTIIYPEVIEMYNLIFNPSIFGKCPNDEWDHYIKYEEIHVKHRGRPKGSKNKKSIIKEWFNNLFN